MGTNDKGTRPSIRKLPTVTIRSKSAGLCAILGILVIDQLGSPAPVNWFLRLANFPPGLGRKNVNTAEPRRGAGGESWGWPAP